MSLEDQDWKDLQVAERIVAQLFVNGQGQQADRLVLASEDHRDLGGWCKRAVVDVITKYLRVSR